MSDTPKLTVRFCMGSSCFSRGNSQALGILKDYLASNDLEDRVELTGALCEGHCKAGPNVTIGDQRYEAVDPSTVIDLVRHHLDAAPA